MKTLGLDGSRAFLKYRTGIEEYSYQVIKHLRTVLPADVTVRLYVRKKLRLRHGRPVFLYPDIDFSLPSNWELRGIWAPRFWTQLGLSLEMLLRPVDTLFVPAHTLPLIGGRKNVVTVHGLEYEMAQRSYGFWERLYMRYSIRYSCYKADTVIAVSQNTKADIIKLYGVLSEKIEVIYEGFVSSAATHSLQQISDDANSQRLSPYLLFIGRLEERKNVARIIDAFEALKKQYHIPHVLFLVGKPGYGYDNIQCKIQNSKFKNEIRELGYVTQEAKQDLLSHAALFIFPSLYEGFGLPVLEAQTYSVPVVTSRLSSLPEVGGEAAFYVDPYSIEDITRTLHQVLSLTPEEKRELKEKMETNLKRFSWEKCAKAISCLLKEEESFK